MSNESRTAKTRLGRKAGDHSLMLRQQRYELELRQEAYDVRRGCYPEAELQRLEQARLGEIEAERAVFARVAECRQAGSSWEQIGAALGVTRQAAHKRFTE